jgi:hypothetical protein
MTGDPPKPSSSLDEIYALLDQNRVDAAKAAQAKFHGDMEAAIATIISISSVAGARVQADSRVASAKVLIDAELAATRLLAEAEMQASKCATEVLTKPREIVESALLEIGRHTTLRLISAAKESVEKIQQDADTAIRVLRETGAIAIREIQTLGANLAEQTKRDAELAAQKLKEYRERVHTPGQAMSDGEDLAEIVIKAAEQASVHLQHTISASLAKINTITDEACDSVREAALAAEKRILDGQELALARLKETLQAHL